MGKEKERKLSPDDQIMADRRGKSMVSRVGKQTVNEINTFFRGIKKETGGKKYQHITSEYHDTRVLQKKTDGEAKGEIEIKGKDIHNFIRYTKLNREN